MNKYLKTSFVLSLLAALLASGTAWADRGGHGHHRHARVGVFVGVPLAAPWYYGSPGYYGPPGYYGYYGPPRYYYSPPVVVQSSPPVYIEQGGAQDAPSDQTNYWYYCNNPQGYYPYVKQCPPGWQKVVPQLPPP